MTEKLSCSFCGKSEDDAAQLITARPDLSICDECIGLMAEIVARKNNEWRERQIEVLVQLRTK
jgi:ATP-dependent protease Clp ATPase subunit